jgi:hypothetical protein
MIFIDSSKLSGARQEIVEKRKRTQVGLSGPGGSLDSIRIVPATVRDFVGIHAG